MSEGVWVEAKGEDRKAGYYQEIDVLEELDRIRLSIFAVHQRLDAIMEELILSNDFKLKKELKIK
jgi:hypothetical protein